MQSNMVTTALELPGHTIVQNVGVVRGIVVKSLSIVGSFLVDCKPFWAVILAFIPICASKRGKMLTS